MQPASLLFPALLVLGIAALGFSLSKRSSKNFPVFILMALVLIAAGALGFLQASQEAVSTSFQPSASATPAAAVLQERQAGPALQGQDGGPFNVSQAQLLSSQAQVFTQTIQPLVCDQGNLVYWRELRVYNLTEKNRTRTFSTITLFVKNAGSKAVKNVVVKEELPLQVAQVPQELVGFSVTPFAFEKGSVVVDWLFNSIEPGETKTVSYTVAKQLDSGVLNDFQAPQAVSESAAAQASVRPQTQAFDYTLLGLAAVVVVLGAVIVLFLRR